MSTLQPDHAAVQLLTITNAGHRSHLRELPLCPRRQQLVAEVVCPCPLAGDMLLEVLAKAYCACHKPLLLGVRLS